MKGKDLKSPAQFIILGIASQFLYNKMLRRIAEARKGSYSYESAPRERVRKRTLYSFAGK